MTVPAADRIRARPGALVTASMGRAGYALGRVALDTVSISGVWYHIAG